MAWKTAVEKQRTALASAASMGPRFNGVEDPRVLVARPQRGPASMGPRFNGVEDPRHGSRAGPGVGGASMGPRFNGVEDPRRL